MDTLIKLDYVPKKIHKIIVVNINSTSSDIPPGIYKLPSNTSYTKFIRNIKYMHKINKNSTDTDNEIVKLIQKYVPATNNFSDFALQLTNKIKLLSPDLELLFPIYPIDPNGDLKTIQLGTQPSTLPSISDKYQNVYNNMIKLLDTSKIESHIKLIHDIIDSLNKIIKANFDILIKKDDVIKIYNIYQFTSSTIQIEQTLKYLKDDIADTIYDLIFVNENSEDRIYRFILEARYMYLRNQIHMSKTYTINDEHKLKYINGQCSEKSKEIASIILDNTKHISYTSFLTAIYNSVDKFIRLCKKDISYILIVSINETNVDKSNYWVAQLVYNYLIHKCDINIIDIIHNINYIKHIDKVNVQYIYCDDCSYTGTQLSDDLNDIIQFVKDYRSGVDKPTIVNTIVPYISEYAKEQLKSVYYSEELKTFKTILQEHSKAEIDINSKHLADYFLWNGSNFDNQVAVYFDHKIADDLSTFPFIYMTGMIATDKYPNSTIYYCKNTKYNKLTEYPIPHKIPFINHCIQTPTTYTTSWWNSITPKKKTLCLPTFYKGRSFYKLFSTNN